MANITTLLKYSLKTNIVKSIYFEIISKVSRYYYTFGKSTAWPTVTTVVNNQTTVVSDEDSPPAIPDTYPYELQTRGDMIYMKYIDSNDAAVVINRINWITGFVYDMYDDYTETYPAASGAHSIDTAKFYVITDEYNVYKCLSNNGNSPSISKPISTSSLATITTDGYVWKFMYTIPLYLRNKFLNSTYMPVVTALTNQFYSKGSIISYAIENRGYGYVRNTWKVKRISVINGGTGYTTSTPITFPVNSSGTRATAVISEVTASGSVNKISVTNTGNLYTYQPQLTVTAPVGASGLDFIIEYAMDDVAYTKLSITGDGYNEYNPYSIKKVNILNRGTFLASQSGDPFAFTPPGLSPGELPQIAVTFRAKSGTAFFEVDTVTVTNSGYGYTTPLVFGVNVFANTLTSVNTAAGEVAFNCNLDLASQKNEAELVPLISSSGEIQAIQIVTPGIGYTYATVNVIGKKSVLLGGVDIVSVDLSSNPLALGYVAGFTKASVVLNFGIGTIDTKQSNVELLAVDGSIEVIKVVNGGNSYNSATTITVQGDGTGCTGQAVVVDGAITKIIVTNPGRGYTYANIIASIGSNAVLRPIIAPRGGHGKDAISELYAKTLMLYTRLTSEKNRGLDMTNDFRQIGVLKNPYIYGDDSFYRKSTGSTCILIICDIITANTNAYNSISIDTQLISEVDNTKSFTVIEKQILNGSYYLVLSVNSNYIPTSGTAFINVVSSTISYSISASTVSNPEVNKYSGELLYIDNRVKFVSSAEQTVAVSTLITF